MFLPLCSWRYTGAKGAARVASHSLRACRSACEVARNLTVGFHGQMLFQPGHQDSDPGFGAVSLGASEKINALKFEGLIIVLRWRYFGMLLISFDVQRGHSGYGL